jgi:hypothetical protein
MTTPRWIIAAALGLALAGCPGSGAHELLETAELEEKQDNLPNARKLYQEVLDRYPDSPEAKVARERLGALAE